MREALEVSQGVRHPSVLEALGVVDPELWLAYLRAEDPEVACEVVRAAERLARDRLLAMEGVRDVIGPHLDEMVRLQVAWAHLAQALEEKEVG